MIDTSKQQQMAAKRRRQTKSIQEEDKNKCLKDCQTSKSWHLQNFKRRSIKSHFTTLMLAFLFLLQVILSLHQLSGALAAHHQDETDWPPNSNSPQDSSVDLSGYGSTNIPSDESPYGSTTAISPTSTSTTTTTVRPTTRKASQRSQVLKVTEAELIRFEEFNVRQPAFNDLMKVWPPVWSSRAHSDGAGSELAPTSQRPRDGSMAFGGDRPSHLRNHLNEDFDDTLVTADQNFDADHMPEPPTWVNYLGDLGDYIYTQLQQLQLDSQSSSASSKAPSGGDDSSAPIEAQRQQRNQRTSARLDAIDELLDDFYYDQYENSQVFYYGPQLVREGDSFEIGCYLPRDHPFEWTKSGAPLSSHKSALSTPTRIRSSDFLDMKRNFSIKIFEASQSDSGNYRCTRMSRKFHKLVVVPMRATPAQIYVIQQRLLSVVNPKLVSASFIQPSSASNRLYTAPSAGPRPYAPLAPNNKSRDNSGGSNQPIPAYLIIEHQPLIVNCNISDEFVLRRLSENPSFQLAWYKNKKLIRASSGPTSGANSNSMRQRQQQQQQPKPTWARVKFLQANGRQMYIGSAEYSDAGDYLCAWHQLPSRQSPTQTAGDNNSAAGDESQALDENGNTIASDPLVAGSQLQLMAPVKLRPFKSVYHARQGSELRLVCQIQRGFPAAHVSWFVGNRLVDGDFLRENKDSIRVLQVAPGSHSITSRGSSSASASSDDGRPKEQPPDDSDQPEQLPPNKRRIVEINPIPFARQQMQLTTNGRGQWIEYKDINGDKNQIDTREHQLKYLQSKLAQLAGTGGPSSSAQSAAGPAGPISASTSASSPSNPPNQASVSILVIKSLNMERHTSRYACRATTRANTDEVTTVIRVLASSAVTTRPSNGWAPLIPGQTLYFECQVVGDESAQFQWFRKPVEGKEETIQPGQDEYEINNNKLTIRRTSAQLAGDYICKVLTKDMQPDEKEKATIKLRSQPYIEEFAVETSHTGKSMIVQDGDRIELTCTVRDEFPVNITWLRSADPDDDKSMVPLPETTTTNSQPAALSNDAAFPPSVILPDQTGGVTIEIVNNRTKKLIIDSVRNEHRSYYICLANNGVIQSRRSMYIRVKDRLVALWPALGIIAECFILFTIIYVWETQRAYKEINAPLGASTKEPAAGGSVATGSGSTPTNKRQVAGKSAPHENVPLNTGP